MKTTLTYLWWHSSNLVLTTKDIWVRSVCTTMRLVRCWRQSVWRISGMWWVRAYAVYLYILERQWKLKFATFLVSPFSFIHTVYTQKFLKLLMFSGCTTVTKFTVTPNLFFLLSQHTPLEHCCVHSMSPFISSSGLSPGSREAKVQRAKVFLNCTEPSVARFSYWSLPVGQYLSDSCCKGSVMILVSWTASSMVEMSISFQRRKWQTSKRTAVWCNGKLCNFCATSKHQSIALKTRGWHQNVVFEGVFFAAQICQWLSIF